ncbi:MULTISPECIES: hypothetical protein [unclassified Paenibacillus]|uniref:hypothetical protein n=1 Tax=unclassified Paenibacillus TaxID=185978 RepID=UPI0030F672EA
MEWLKVPWYGMAKGGKRIEKDISYKTQVTVGTNISGIGCAGHINIGQMRIEEHRHQTLDFMWTNVQAFDPAGHLNKEGLTKNEVYHIASNIKFIEQRTMLGEKEK